MNKLMIANSCCFFSIDCRLMWIGFAIAITIVLAVVLPVWIKHCYEYRTLKYKAKQKELEQLNELKEAKKRYDNMVEEFETNQKQEAILRYLIDSTENESHIEKYKSELRNLYKTDKSE